MQSKNNMRAKQFMAFDALKGFREEIEVVEKEIVPKIELSEDMEVILSKKLNQIEVGKMVTVIYFEKGEYLKLTGMISKIDYIYRSVDIVKKKIYFEDILDINGEGILDYKIK